MIGGGTVIGVDLIGNEDDVHGRISGFVGDKLIGKFPADSRVMLVFMGVVVEQEQIDHQKLPGLLDDLQYPRQYFLLPLLVPAARLIGQIV
ncbi:hypothetical protein D3C75_1278580 [compost metagenome]